MLIMLEMIGKENAEGKLICLIFVLLAVSRSEIQVLLFWLALFCGKVHTVKTTPSAELLFCLYHAVFVSLLGKPTIQNT